jgi:drug/metabolite transporter (DMT)-like permease
VISELSPVVVLPLATWIAVLIFALPGGYQALSFDFAKPELNHWIALMVWGLGPVAIGTLIWFSGLAHVRGSTASGFMGAMPASALILSYAWLGDEFHAIHLLGFALVFVSIALITWAHRISEEG